MKKLANMKHIVIIDIIFTIVAVLGFAYIYHQLPSPEAGIKSIKTNYELKEGILYCDDTIEFEIKDMPSFRYPIIPVDNINEISEYELKVNGKKILYNEDYKTNLFVERGSFFVKFNDGQRKNNVTVHLKYLLKPSEYVSQDYLCLQRENHTLYFNSDHRHTYSLYYVDNLEINFKSDVMIESLQSNIVDDKDIVEHSKYSYSIIQKNYKDKFESGKILIKMPTEYMKKFYYENDEYPLKNSIEENEAIENYYQNNVAFPQKAKNFILELEKDNAEKINRENKEKQELEESNNKIKTVFIVTGILLVIAIFLNNTPSTSKSNYNMDELISPTLAKIIIDGKMDIGNLIMTSIVDLISRGNIELINDYAIRLVHTDNLEPYEEDIISIIFDKNSSRKNEITFAEINMSLVDFDYETEKFYIKVKKLRRKMKQKLYDLKILSLKRSFINTLVACCSILLIVNLPTIINNLDISDIIEIDICVMMGFYLIKKNLNRKLLTNFEFIFFPLIIISYATIINKQNVIYILAIFLLNIYIIYININKCVLTRKGKNELIKLLEFKNYLEEDELLQDVYINSSMVQKKVLAYATAFGIPKNIINKLFGYTYNF